MDPMSRKLYRTNAEIERQEKLSEAAQLMSRLGFILDKTRSFDQFLYRLRRKRCMKIVWTRRSPNEDTLLAEQTRPVFEQHYPGMSRVFPGGHRMNTEVVTHTLLPFIRELNVI